ncbi:multicopper oxidase domain-containing protein [Defluviimonas sp. WL0024]|uniref:Copper-containing nitrite reductase n=2 Tax=Albidovulum TaxID=205889 RepID=A0ABT3J4V0_9RHOB|nr:MULTISPECIES: multicopper oxidase domain-containing protein [Defluviimonas]MCU9849185.1 multicopper oxidase domain-containing protein [Defluviimonas sp. WL0024]MCW3782688.1 multicopper oxidase domain-containing protein [Defluviimonas salinarum]
MLRFTLDRRGFLGRLLMTGGAGVVPVAAAATPHDHGGNATVGAVDHAANGFDPHEILTDWETGTVETLPDGRRLRRFEITAVDREIEIAPGLIFPAWTYNGRVPGPTLRATEGELIRIEFINSGSHVHTMHFHGIHSARMDGVPGAGEVAPGESFTYEFTARPYGCHLYHCHSQPLKRHIHKGLYGAFIVDPDPDLHPEARAVAEGRLLGHPRNAEWQEMVIVMNGFDMNFDDENEVYAANSIAFAYQDRPIPVERSRPVRIYLVNVTEFDPINSFHMHANFFDYYDHGTTLTPTLRTIDTVMLCQAQRGIIEMSFAEHEPGLYMFHAHQSEFAELGWMSLLEVS